MPQGHQRWSRLVIILGPAIILMMSAARSAWAEQVVFEGTIPTGTVIENDVILRSNKRQSRRPRARCRQLCQRSLTLGRKRPNPINGSVDGSLVAVGEKVTINSQIDGSVYVVAGSLDVEPDTIVGRSLILCRR